MSPVDFGFIVSKEHNDPDLTSRFAYRGAEIADVSTDADRASLDTDRDPLLTFEVMAAIHCDALRLWLKVVRLVPRRNVAGQDRDETILATDKTRAYIIRR